MIKLKLKETPTRKPFGVFLYPASRFPEKEKREPNQLSWQGLFFLF
jgi:hypothetical protein